MKCSEDEIMVRVSQLPESMIACNGGNCWTVGILKRVFCSQLDSKSIDCFKMFTTLKPN